MVRQRKRVNKQPTLGSLFLSQNSSTWTPDQNRDLMFKLYRASFASSATVLFKNNNNIISKLKDNPFTTTEGSNVVKINHEGHGLSVNDLIDVSGLIDSGDFGGMFGSSIDGRRRILKVDHTGFTFRSDSNATSSTETGGKNISISHNVIYDTFVPQIQTLIPSDKTKIVSKIKKTSGSSYAGGRNTDPDYSKDNDFSDVSLNTFNYNEKPSVILNEESSNFYRIPKSFELKLELSTEDSSNSVSPVIDLQRCAIATFENVIDKQDETSSNGFNIPIKFVAETDRIDGSHAAKHITSTIVLDEPAVGLKILFAANRPSVAGFRVFYKIGTSDENIDDVPYVEIAEETSNPADENSSVFREYEYLPGGQTGTLNEFTQFKVKIVMTSTNSSKIPVIRDFRTIALIT